jgi:signal transduction histidine kinase
MDEKNQIIFSLVIGTFLMLLLTLAVIYFVTLHRKKYLLQQNRLQKIEHEKQQEMLFEIIKAQEEERNRIARNLHDGVGISISMIQLNMTRHAATIKKKGENMEGFNRELKNLEDVYTEISRICHNLYPISLEKMGLSGTMREILEKVKNSSPGFTLTYSVEENELEMSMENKLNVFRIFQELLNNIIKYANCTLLTITVSQAESVLNIEFTHNGAKFDNTTAEQKMREGKGLGLTSMRNRATLMKGKIDYFSSPENCRIVLKVPLKHGTEN